MIKSTSSAVSKATEPLAGRPRVPIPIATTDFFSKRQYLLWDPDPAL